MRLSLLLASCLLTSCALECTAVGCTSTLEIRLSHSLDLGAGPYRVDITTPQQELRCSIGPELGDELRSCFGYRFATLRWDESSMTVTMTDPFGDVVVNPTGAPFESIEVVVYDGPDELSRRAVAVDPGEPQRPNGPGCEPTCWAATVDASL